MITTIVKVTLSQMRRLEAGETVGAHVYDPEHCFYVVDDGLLLPEDSGKYVLRTDDDGESYYYDTLDLTWDEIDNKPSTFPPSSHTHPLNQITGIGTIGTTAASTIAYTTSMSGVTTASPALVSAGAIKQECDYIWASVNNINNYCAWQADVDRISLTVSGNVVTFTNASGTSVSFTTVSAWSDITGKPTLSVSGRTITIGDNSTTWTNTNTAGLTWDSANHAVKAGVDNTLATIPTATTSTQGIIAIGTAATQAAAGNHNHDSAYAAKGHTHTTSITTSSAASYTALNHGTEYAITAGGTTAAFKMPAQYTLPSASAGAYGGVKVGYVTSGTNYKLQLDGNGNAYVSVPWSDTNYYHTAGSWSGYAYTLTGNGGASNITITLPTVVSTIGMAATGLYVATNGGATSTIGSVIGTTAVSTKTISASSASIASGNADLVTGGAIYTYVQNEGGKVKSISVNGTTYTPTSGVITLPSYPSVSDSTITIKQDGQSDQTFTLNGGAKTITLVDTNTWRPLGTGASDAAAGNHTHSAYVNQNAYGNIKVGSTTTAASSVTDTITFAAGGDLGVSISGKTITYSVTLPESLPASDVSEWAKAANKPTYTASEVGALPSTTAYLKVISKSGNTYTITTSSNSTTTWTIPTTPGEVGAAAASHTHGLADITGISSIGTTTVSTSTITTTIGSSTTSTKIPTEGAVRDALNGFAPTGNYVTKEMFSYNASTGVLTIDLGN